MYHDVYTLYSYVHITKMQKVSFLIDQLANWSKLKLR